MSILGGIAGNLAGGNVGRAVVSLVLDTTGYNSQLQKAKGETAAATGGMESSFSRFKVGAVAVGAVAGAAIVDFAKHAVAAASDEEESLNKARVVFGQASKDVEEFASTSAESFGISKQAALEAAASFGNMLLSAGLAQEQAADMSTSIVQLAADLASFNNVDPSVALERLRSGLSGQARPLRAFGILLSESSVQQEAYADGIAKVGETLTEGEKVQARYNLIMKQTGTAQGDFARTSDGLANSQRILKAELEDLTAEAGKALLPAIIDLTHATGDVVESAGPALVGAFGDIGEAAKTTASLVTALTDTLNDIPENINVQLELSGLDNFKLPELGGNGEDLPGFLSPLDPGKFLTEFNKALPELNSTVDSWFSTVTDAFGGDQQETFFEAGTAAAEENAAALDTNAEAADNEAASQEGVADALTRATRGHVVSNDALRSVVDSARAAAIANEDYAGTIEAEEKALRKVADAQQAARLAQLEAAGGLLGLVSSLKQTKEDQAELNQLQRQGKTNTQEYRDAVFQATQDQLEFQSAVRQYVEDNPNQTIAQSRRVLKEMAAQAGITGSDFKAALGNALDTVGGKVDNLQGKWENLRDRLSQGVAIQVSSAQLDLAAARATRLEQQLDRLA